MYRQSNNLSWLNMGNCPRKYISESGGYRTIGAEIVEKFWKDLGKVYPFTDEELSESISSKKAILKELDKQCLVV